MDDVRVTSREESRQPNEEELRLRMQADGLSPMAWSNAPLDRYTAHFHAYDKVIYVIAGSIKFTLPETKQELTLQAGDRLDLPAGTVHSAIVGGEGVACLEAHID